MQLSITRQHLYVVLQWKESFFTLERNLPSFTSIELNFLLDRETHSHYIFASLETLLSSFFYIIWIQSQLYSIYVFSVKETHKKMVVDLEWSLKLYNISFHKMLFWQVQQPMQYHFVTCSNILWWLFTFCPAQEYRQNENPAVDIFHDKT